MNIITTIRDHVQTLVERHGSKVGMCAKIAVALLMPGGGGIPEAIRALCDYCSDQELEFTDQRLLEGLGQLRDNQDQVAIVLEHLNGQLSSVIHQMSRMADIQVPEELLTELMRHAIINQREVAELRTELISLQPELSTIQAQNAQLLHQQAFAGDLLSQVNDSLNAALGFCAPLMSEGISAQQTASFLQAHMCFQRCLLRGDFGDAETALMTLKDLSSTSDTVKVCEIALRSVRGDFEGADRVAQMISNDAQHDTLIQAMSLSIASATRATQQQTSATRATKQQILLVSHELSNRQPGEIFGDACWVLKSQIGRGGMGVVWSVESPHQGLGALKLMTKKLSDDPSFVKRFEAEINALRRVKHSAVVSVLDAGKDKDGTLFFVMELIEGTSLRSKIKQGHYLTLDQARSLLTALLEALDACHAAGVVHRDLKPDNIMLKQDNTPVLIDFGLAQQDEGLGQESRVVLTRGYAAPEQLQQRGQVGPAADLYALGQTLIEALGGWNSIPRDLEKLMDRLTHNDPLRRGSAQEHLQALSCASESIKYYLSIGRRRPEGPLTVRGVAERLLKTEERSLIWWEGAPAWHLSDSIPEVMQAVKEARALELANFGDTPPK